MRWALTALLLGVLTGPADSDWYEFCQSGAGVYAQREVCKSVRTPEAAAEVKTLAGLEGVAIYVDPPPPPVPSLGADGLTVYREVELGLSKRGIRVVGDASTLAGHATLYVRVHAMQGEPGTVYSVSLMLFQNVALERAPGKVQPAVTWEADAMGFDGAPGPEELLGAVRVMADYFAADFRAANPSE